MVESESKRRKKTRVLLQGGGNAYEDRTTDKRIEAGGGSGGYYRKQKGYKATRSDKMKKRKVDDSDEEDLDDDDDEYEDDDDGEESDREKKHKKQRRYGALSDDEERGDEIDISKTRKIQQRKVFSDDDSSEQGSLDGVRGKETLTEQLCKKIAERDRTIEKLETELARHRTAGTRLNNTQVREQLKWTGEEINFAETVHNFCKVFLFPRVKFLKDDWQRYLPKDKKSLYSVCMRHLKIPQGSEPKDIWERVIVPSIARKYQNMKCNLNGEVKSLYMSMKPATFMIQIVYISLIWC